MRSTTYLPLIYGRQRRQEMGPCATVSERGQLVTDNNLTSFFLYYFQLQLQTSNFKLPTFNFQVPTSNFFSFALSVLLSKLFSTFITFWENSGKEIIRESLSPC